jgi:hypothetical protein
MSEFVGVKPVTDIMKNPSLKKEALIFSKIAVPSLDTCTGFIENWFGPYAGPMVDEVNWLIEQGILFEPDRFLYPTKDDPRYEEVTNEFIDFRKKFKEAQRPIVETYKTARRKGIPVCYKKHEMDTFLDRLGEQNWILARMLAVRLRLDEQMDSQPCSDIHKLPEDKSAGKGEVVQITLKAFPQPSPKTPWEQILEYRNDPDSQSKFLALRNWMNETARAELEPMEIEQKLEYLMDEYQKHMRLHRMKTNAGFLQTAVISTAELLEDLVKIRWGKIAKGLFSFRERRIALLEGELNSPGSEIAYIIKAQESFMR